MGKKKAATRDADDIAVLCASRSGKIREVNTMLPRVSDTARPTFQDLFLELKISSYTYLETGNIFTYI